LNGGDSFLWIFFQHFLHYLLPHVGNTTIDDKVASQSIIPVLMSVAALIRSAIVSQLIETDT